MKTITLQEALERATKGPLMVDLRGESGAKAFLNPECQDDSEYMAYEVTGHGVGEDEFSATAALLAHSRNELPALVEAAQGVTDFLDQRSDYWSASDLKAAIKKLREALRSAQNVRMP